MRDRGEVAVRTSFHWFPWLGGRKRERVFYLRLPGSSVDLREDPSSPLLPSASPSIPFSTPISLMFYLYFSVELQWELRSVIVQ